MTRFQMHLQLPSAQYKVTFDDGSLTILSIHPGESLEGPLSELLFGADIGAEGVTHVVLLGRLSFDEEVVGES